jgi:integrase
VFLALCLGLRRSELLGLEWNAVDMDARVVHVVKTVVCQKNVLVKNTTKSASSRRDLPMSDEVYQFLKNLQHEQKLQRLQFGPDYIVNDVVCKHKNGTEYKPTDISHKFNEVLKAHDLRHIRFHDLRHTCASLMLLNHVPLKAVQVFMGHSSASTTMDIYAHVDLTQKAAAADTLCDVLSDALSV